MAKRTVETGQRYRDVQPGIYGRSAASDWIVKRCRPTSLASSTRASSALRTRRSGRRSRPKCWSIRRIRRRREEEWPAIDTPGTEPSYLRAERDDASSLAVSWRGVLVAALLFGCLALLTAYFQR